MKNLQQQLTNYALYHRSRRNVRTHFIGIPLIVYAVICLLARIEVYFIAALDMPLHAAHIVATILVLYYLALSLSLGVVMGVILFALMYLAWPIVTLTTSYWLAFSVGLFLVGWLFQFIGHYFEGKKPAFVDDLVGLIIGPLFVLVEFLFLLGLYQSLAEEIEAEVGPAKP
ncbi:DUF962 domain-containing protein [Marinomonas agarivorans]|nr:DUF962 domain-containing protein [Marinomonas agarivorans]